ncbi:MAG: ATP-binding protein [Desulfopila sp.]|jgi:PAS domain S-box-containing protein|nr:ATP-binding protein [Desulfopila sp.]
MMKSSLSVMIILRIGVAVIFCLLVLGVYEFYKTESRIAEQLEGTLQLVGKRLGSSLVLPVWNIDEAVVERIVLTEMDDRNIAAVQVVDLLSGSMMIGKGRDEEWNVIDISRQQELEYSREVTVPIVINSTDLGVVMVYVTDRFSKEVLFEGVLGLVTKLTVLFFIILAVLIVSVNILVSSPLLTLSRSCRKVADGDFSIKLDTDGTDEIASLARSFANMRDAVREKIAALNEEIGERKRSETELQKLRVYLKNIVDSMPSMLIGVDCDSKVTEWNIEAEKMTGVLRSAAQGKELLEIVPALASLQSRVADAVEGRSMKTDLRLSLEINHVTRIMDVTIYSLVSNGTEGAVIRLDDVSEKVRLEEIMVQTEKMMSVGGLAAGMAHEINNPLAGIMQSVQVIQNRLLIDLKKNQTVASECNVSMESIDCYVEKRDIPRMLTSILHSGERASRIIKNMLSFSRKSTSRYTPCVISELLDQTIELATSDYDLKKNFDFRRIKILRQYDPSVAPVRCDPATIQQVFFNILRNAAQAMVLEDDFAAAVHEPTIVLRIYQVGKYAKVEIEDNGAGMDEDTRKRIFEPFFTTKSVDIGTGLGLSVSFFIVKENHNGSIEVRSSPGNGATFTISLPL